MNGRRWLAVGIALVAFTLLVSAVAAPLEPHQPLSGTAGSPSAPSARDASASARASAPSLPGIPSESATSGAGASPPLSSNVPYGLQQAEAAVASHELPESDVSFPHTASAAETPAVSPDQTVPSSPGIPAPMGIADVGHGLSGPYAYNSSSFVGNIDIRSFSDYNPGYSAFGASPNWMTFQLNTVTVNTSYPGATNGVFWTQNIAHFNGTTIQFEASIWNFSSPETCLESGTLLSFTGVINHCLYEFTGPTINVSTPLELSLYNNITLVPGLGGEVPQVTFGYVIDKGGTFTSGIYNTVTFNGLGSSTSPPGFGVNGFAVTPSGSEYWDSEFVLGGNGGGSNAVLQEINASLQLRYLNSGATYVNVPSAYDYGEDTSDTSYGVAASYFGTVENLTQGPSMLYGLWNTTAGAWGDPAPTTTWTLTVTGLPDYAFAFLQNTSDFVDGLPSLSYWPSAADGTLTTTVPALLDGNTYTLVVYANGYDTGTFTLSGSGTTPETLVADPSVFDTPVYLSSDAQATAFGASGVAGVHADSTNLWINDTESSVAPAFRLTNDLRYPTFVLFAELNLSISVHLDNFVQDASTFTYTSPAVSGTFSIPGWSQGYYFNYGSGHFTVTNTTIVGNSTIYYSSGKLATPIAAIEFWWTFDSNASNIAASGYGVGVDVLFGSGSTVTNVTADDGANATELFGTIGAHVNGIVATGTDSQGLPTIALVAEQVLDSNIRNVIVENGAYGVVVRDFTDSNVTNLSVANGVPGTITGFFLSSLRDLSFDETGALEIVNAEVSTVTNLSVVGGEGIDVDGADVFTATNVNATEGALGFLALDADSLHLNGISVDGDGLGASVEASQGVTVDGLRASDLSVGLGVEESLSVTVENVVALSGSLGVYSGLNDFVNLTNYNASESALSTNYFSSTIGLVPTAAVYTFDDQNTTIGTGVAYEYNYGVVSNGSNYLTISSLHEVNGVWGVALDDTANSTIATSLLYGNQIGVWTTGTFDLDLDVVTIEASAGYGLWVASGSSAIVALSNFVGNNGASTDGVFSNAHLQAGVSGTTSIAFDHDGLDNYWSDWNASVGPYPIATGISDPAPLTAFYSNWLAFTEVGLPHGTAWGILLDGTSYFSDLPLVILPSYSLGDPTFQFTVERPLLYTPTPPSGSVDYTGTNKTVVITFVQTAWDVTFAETGLTTGALWKVTVNGTTQESTNTTIVFVEPRGTYNYTVGAPGYLPTPSNGTVVVPSSSLTVNISFTSKPKFTVTFSETGLTSGTSWSVSVNGTTLGSTTSSVVFDLENGSYPYSLVNVSGYTLSPPTSGTIVVNGAPQTIDVTYTPIVPSTYAITFSETGLVAGTLWKVTLGSATETSDNATVVFHEAPGLYGYAIPTVANYTVSPTNGTVNTTAGPQTVSVTFTALPPTEYTVTFTETGLPASTSWSVTLDGQKLTSTTTSIQFTETAGSYSFTVASTASGYTASPASGTVVVTTANATQAITFTAPAPAPTNKTGSLFGLSELDWIVIGVVLVLVVGGLLAAVLLRRRGGSSSTVDSDDSGSSPPSDIDAPPPSSGGSGDTYE